jgi:hypothetical protein
MDFPDRTRASAVRGRRRLEIRINYLGVIRTAHFLDITSLFDQQNARLVKKKYTVVEVLPRHVWALLSHLHVGHKLSVYCVVSVHFVGQIKT